MKKTITTIILILVNLVGYTQEQNIVLGVKKIIKSTILNTEKEIQIYLPDSYHKTSKTYPVQMDSVGFLMVLT